LLLERDYRTKYRFNLKTMIKWTQLEAGRLGERTRRHQKEVGSEKAPAGKAQSKARKENCFSRCWASSMPEVIFKGANNLRVKNNQRSYLFPNPLNQIESIIRIRVKMMKILMRANSMKK
jgi:hypothetical protein